MHHDSLVYNVQAIPAKGYKFSHWEEWFRQSNSPDDFGKEVFDARNPTTIYLATEVRGTKIKRPLSYLVAHFKPIAEPETIEETFTISIEEKPNQPTLDGILAQAERLVEMIKEFKGE